MDDDVKNILAILQQGTTEEPTKSQKTEKKDTKKALTKKTTHLNTPSVVPKESVQEKPSEEKKMPVEPKPKSMFLAKLIEPEDKSIYNSKVLIREEIYEIFMSLKRIKKFKSVSTLIDYALAEYIKNNREDIKKTLYDNKKHDIL